MGLALRKQWLAERYDAKCAEAKVLEPLRRNAALFGDVVRAHRRRFSRPGWIQPGDFAHGCFRFHL